MNDILSVQKVAASRRGTSLDGFVSETLPAVMRGDPSRIRQVLLNLVSNAIKFAPGGRVNVRVCEKTDEYNKPWIYFEVTDTGIGIPEGAMSRIFQAFSQADSSTAKRFGGTGLGLSICRKLVDLMDGKIGIESKVGVGSKFWFLIPLEMGEGIAQPAFRQPGPGELEPDFRKLRRILVVEDNQMNQKIINGMLKKLGYRSQTVGTGDEAIDALRDFTYDLVLMDCQLPGRDGFDTTRVIRGGAVPDAQDILIVAMTANALKGDREKCLNAGMNDYLAKPVRLAELEFMLDKHLCQMNPALPLAASK
jgi:CheY-like chemotaxis protein